MSERPYGISWESFADASVRRAMEQGEFSNLPGAGKPIDGIDKPYQEDWWLKALLKREDLSVPCPSLEIRADLEQTMVRILRMSSEPDVRREVESLNKRIVKVNRTTISGPATSIATMNIDALVAQWRLNRPGSQEKPDAG